MKTQHSSLSFLAIRLFDPNLRGLSDECSRRLVRRTCHLLVTCPPLQQGGILALKLLDRTAAPALCQGLRHGVGKDFFLSLLYPVEDGSRDGLWRSLRYVQGSGHLGINRSGQDGMNAYALSSQQSA